MRNLRIAFRTLLRRSSFTAIAVLTLGLGIGATTAIFTVVNAVVLEPLPYPESERLVMLEHAVPLANPDWRWGLSEAGYFAMRAGNRSFEELAVAIGLRRRWAHQRADAYPRPARRYVRKQHRQFRTRRAPSSSPIHPPVLAASSSISSCRA